MARSMMLPWLAPRWHEIVKGIDRLPPGLMLVGTSGLGKLELAMAAAAAILCERRTTHGACGACSACQSLEWGLHPDLHLLTTEQLAQDLPVARAQLAARYLEPDTARGSRKPRQIITVDQIRTVIERLGTHSHGGGARVAVIVPASSLNANAANALLKVLEEPPGDTRFILVSSGRDAVPATVLSRVSVVECATPPFAQARDWLLENGVPAARCAEVLALSSGAPLAALRQYDQGVIEHTARWKADLLRLLEGALLPVSMAASIGNEQAPRFLSWLERLIGDVLARRHGRRDEMQLVGADPRDSDIESLLISRPLWDIMDSLQVYRCRQQRAVDAQLFMEDVLIAIWQKD
ncbi:MAG: DNA polymerase III subunit delta' [Proteobacteria bacterium]|nr:MAG: DNA polymerase III subunit delta' [Pseudomonadota bacterium]